MVDGKDQQMEMRKFDFRVRHHEYSLQTILFQVNEPSSSDTTDVQGKSIVSAFLIQTVRVCFVLRLIILKCNNIVSAQQFIRTSIL